MIAPIIVADDDAMIRSILRSLFTGVGQHIVSATSGQQAVDLASKVQAKMIMLDLRMPGLNGIVACERIRALPNHADTPIIVLTANDELNVQKAAFKAGATIFVAKPFQPMALLEALLPYLRLDPVSQGIVLKGARRVREIEWSNTGYNSHLM